MAMMSNAERVVQAKRALRGPCEARRRVAARAAGDQAGIDAVGHFLSAVTLPRGCVVAGYWPMRDEFDPRPLLDALHKRGHPCSLPGVIRRSLPLVFRAWSPGDALVEAALGTRVPRDDAPSLIPALLLVPLLAFDDRGYRLGYGGGFYDRSLAGPSVPIAVGCAYAAQRIDVLPVDHHDRRLDWIVTEKAIMEIT